MIRLKIRKVINITALTTPYISLAEQHNSSGSNSSDNTLWLTFAVVIGIIIIYRLVWDKVTIEKVKTQNKKLSDSLKEKKLRNQQLTDKNKHLDLRIKQRTADLSSAIEKMKFSQEAAKSSHRAKKTLLSNISHQIRTPLNAILGFSEVLLNEKIAPEYKEKIRSIESSGQLLLRLLNDMLDLAKLDSNNLLLQKNEVDLIKLITDIDQQISIAINNTNLTSSISIEPALPGLCLIDEKRIRQILINLIGNAYHFTYQGFIKISITHTVEKKNTINLQIKVEDSGIGIATDQKELIFKAFQQQENQNFELYGGLGLGLSICQKLIHLMNGSLHVESELNKSSCFTVRIPNISTIETQHAETPVINKGYQFSSAKILIADDDAINRQLISSFLANHDFKFREAADGSECVAIAKNWEPDLILMDIKMPKLNGLQATNKIREFSRVPVIAISSFSTDEEIDKMRLICNSYICKPFKKRQRREKISEFTLHKNTHQTKEKMNTILIDPNNYITEEEINDYILKLKSTHNNYQSVSNSLAIQELHEFIEKIDSLTQGRLELVFGEWLKDMKFYLKEFDMKKLTNRLGDFPSILKELQ
ncbi:MAG: response regulator [Lentisphaeraceae bacterium]|nr:response regulator [Lentisphaeraceae bacterium]